MRSNKYLFSILIIFAAGILSSCAPSQPLTYNGVENFKISDIKSEPKINVDLKLHNPNPIGFKLKKINLALTVDNRNIGNLDLDKQIRLRGNQDFTLPLTFTTSVSELSQVIKPGIADVFSGKSIPFDFQGQITVQKFIFFRRTFQFDFNDDVNLNKIKID